MCETQAKTLHRSTEQHLAHTTDNAVMIADVSGGINCAAAWAQRGPGSDDDTKVAAARALRFIADIADGIAAAIAGA
jgi:hypothetical protein